MSGGFDDFDQPERHIRLRPIIAVTLRYRSLMSSVAEHTIQEDIRHDERPFPPLRSPFPSPGRAAIGPSSAPTSTHSSPFVPRRIIETKSSDARIDRTLMTLHIPMFQYHHMMSASTGAALAFKHGKDDGDGNYIALIGELFDFGRYEVLAQAGKGSFGQVVRALDRVTREEVAIKIIRNRTSFYNQACVELRILQKLGSLDPEDNNNIVRVRHYFHHQNHLCIVFELLSINLYELLSITQFTGVSLNLVRKFGQQLLTSLAFLSRPEISIVHCDLKPENVLLCDPKRSMVKLIDFGSSAPAAKPNPLYKYIQSRYYRAPEVILGLPFSFPIDMWSLGCVLVEMHVGSPVFDGKNELDQLVKIMDYLGPPPQRMLAASNRMQKLCMKDVHGTIYFVPEFQRCIQRKSLMDFIGVTTGGPRGMRYGQRGHSESDYFCFYDLILRMLTYDPKERITPREALEHPFFCRQRFPHISPSSSSPFSPTSV